MYLTKEKYLEKVKAINNDYWNRSYKDRWVYMQEVISELKLINPKSSVEIGTMGISLIETSDCIDYEIANVDKDGSGKKIIFDARKTPYPIDNKQYDVFIALQVLEHLSPNQSNVFSEIKRISNYAIITLPYLWNCPEDIEHHNIGMEKICQWTNFENPYKVDIKQNRIMLCYKF